MAALRLPLRTLTVGAPARSSYPSLWGKTVLHFPNQQSRLSNPSLRFSTYATTKLQNENPDQNPPKRHYKDTGPKLPETPLAMSFDAMGLGKNLRLFIVAMLSASAIIEGLTYGREIWIWWRGDEGDPV